MKKGPFSDVALKARMHWPLSMTSLVHQQYFRSAADTKLDSVPFDKIVLKKIMPTL